MKVSSLAVAAVLVALTGCGRSSAGAGQGGPLDVAGQVIFQLNGGAVPGAKVKVGNKAIVTTSPDGKFSVRSVSNPYDITVVSPDGSVAAVYAGLTRTDPTVALRLTGPGAPAPIRSATITGRLSGGVGFPLPAGHRLQAFFTAPAGAAVAIENGALDADGSYTLFLNWRGDANVDCTVRLVEFVADASGNPVSFDATGSIPLNLASGQTSSGIDINLGPVGNVRFTGTVSMAPGYTLGARSLRASFPPSDSLLVAFDTSPNGAFDYPGFSAPGLVFKLTAVGQKSDNAFVQAWRAGFTGGTPIDLRVPAAPTFQAPTSGVTSGTTLSWSPLDGAVYDFTASTTTVGTGPLLEVVTGGTSFQVPDLSAMGFAWPKSTSYRMDLLAFAPRTADDVAGGNEQPPEDHDGVFAKAAPVEFTTAP
jgi:hypothetical protein